MSRGLQCQAYKSLIQFHRLPNVPRPRMSICILADAADIDRAKQIDLEYMSVDDLKKFVHIVSRFLRWR